MKFSAVSILAYNEIYHDNISELKSRGYNMFRFISHDQTARYNNGSVVHTPWMAVSADICREHKATYFYTLGEKSVPIDLQDARGIPDDWDKYTDWLVQTLIFVLDNLDIKMIYLEVGNEMESSKSNWTVDEHKQLYDAALNSRQTVIDTVRGSTIRIGGGAHVDRNQEARFIDITNYIKSKKHDFISAHVYGDISWLDTIMFYAGESPVFITESGPDWKANPVYDNDPVAVDKWHYDFFTKCNLLGVKRAFKFLGYNNGSTPWFLVEITEDILA